jgi:hypothetical protein
MESKTISLNYTDSIFEREQGQKYHLRVLLVWKEDLKNLEIADCPKHIIL